MKRSADTQPKIRTVLADPSNPPKGASILWTPNCVAGCRDRGEQCHCFQSEVLMRDEYEIMIGGAKAAGKSAVGIVWVLKGNPDLQMNPTCHADISYINHPNYRCLVLRRNATDLADWIDKAKVIYQALGAVYHERPIMHFEFPTGAKVVLGHLNDSDAYSKYQGQEFQRFLLEEATLVPDLRSYLLVRSCIRSIYPELREQILLTCNPTGPGHTWVSDRFVLARDTDGRRIPPRTTIKDEFGRTRVFIAGTARDNPKIGQAYIQNLQGLPEAERRAFLDGDWDALSGNFFSSFRIKPREGEPPEAQHVIPPREITPWVNRWIGMDWGYGHEGAAYWFANEVDGRVHTYREMVAKHRSAEQWGVEIALATFPDLRGMDSKAVTMWLSFDAFDRRNNQRTIAEQIASGINSVLGHEAACIEEGDLDAEGISEQGRSRARAAILLRPSTRQRVSSAQYIQAMLRWEPMLRTTPAAYSEEMAVKLLKESFESYQKYVDLFKRNAKPEVLPKVLIHDCCPMIVDTIQTRVFDDDDKNDVKKDDDDPRDNCYDAWRYGLFAHAKIANRKPEREFVRERVDAAREAYQHSGRADYGNSLVWIARHVEDQYRNGTDGDAPAYGPINLIRRSSRLATLVQ